MAKTLNQFLEGYLKVKNPDEQKFVDKHVVAKHSDRNGNDDEVFKGSKVKQIDRRKERHGYNPGEDEKVYEELKGNQHKIDANKNGKVDAHDFKLLRKKKKVAEEVGAVEETYGNKTNYPKRHISVNGKYTATTTWAKTNSEAKSKFLEKNPEHKNSKITIQKEEAEQIDETAKVVAHLIKRYGDNVRKSHVRSAANDFGVGYVALAHAVRKKLGVNRLEEEQIDELSTATLQRYRKKARAQGNAIVDKMKMGGGDWSKDQKDTKTLRKRAAGAQASGKQLVKRGESLKTEEVEIEEKIDMEKASMGTVIKDFQKSNAPQFKGKSQEKRRAMAIAAKLTAERGGKPLRKEEKLADLLGDLTESHRRTMLSVFDKLNEDNQKKFLEACQTPEGVESMLDFAISHRGE